MLGKMERELDFEYKIKALREILDRMGYDGVEIKSQANFSFITRGRGFIGLASTIACCSLFITRERVCLVGENIDAKRVYQEQLLSNPKVELMAFPWDEPSKRGVMVDEITAGKRMAQESDIEPELFKIRTLLSEHDKEDFRRLCLETAQLVENICKNLTPGIREYELAGVISKELWCNNIEPITLLVAFDERAMQYRHPVMTGNLLKNYALVGICGRRNGLIVSLTRNVLLTPDMEMMEKHSKCIRVNGAIWNSLKVENKVSDTFKSAMEQYGLEGYPLEYKEHHQGGLTGFIPRELRATLECSHVIRAGEAYAYNPTIQGAKVEDTILVTEEGLEILTYTGSYAYEMCEVDGKQVALPTVYIINS